MHCLLSSSARAMESETLAGVVVVVAIKDS
jgi:hypothetical protein